LKLAADTSCPETFLFLLNRYEKIMGYKIDNDRFLEHPNTFTDHPTIDATQDDKASSNKRITNQLEPVCRITVAKCFFDIADDSRECVLRMR
jgi:hypothetical protein